MARRRVRHQARVTGRSFFPWHMARAWRQVRHYLPAVHVVVEVADARAPAATRNPRLARLLAGKAQVLALTHADLAAEEVTRAWVAWLRAQGAVVCAVDAASGAGVSALAHAVAAAAGGDRPGRGPARAMLVGVPNVGKSSLLNRLVGRARARVGREPGVTRGPQWVSAGGCQYLDLPGILPPRLDRESLLLQAILGTVPESAVPPEAAAARLVAMVRAERPREIELAYGLKGEEGEPEQVLEAVARASGYLLAGGRPDIRRAAVALLGDFRDGRLGRLTLEKPPVGKQATAEV